jgi:diguanylate cyclase (GGDEF)-like protein
MNMSMEGAAGSPSWDGSGLDGPTPMSADGPRAKRSEGATADRQSIIGRDPLTGLLDFDAFEEVLRHEHAREQRYRRPTSVVAFDLDGLSRITDRLGVDAADRIEVALADAISRLARRADYVARLQAGRYAVLLPETDEVAAINYVERIRRACELWLESGAIAMRLAIGWACTRREVPLPTAVRIATDRMLAELASAPTSDDDHHPVTASVGAQADG